MVLLTSAGAISHDGRNTDNIIDKMKKIKDKILSDPLLDRGDINRVFAENTNDMSLLSMQVADDVAGKSRVLFVDFGMTKEMRRFRYSYESGIPYTFPDTLIFSKAGEPVSGSLHDRDLFGLICGEFSGAGNIDVIIINDTSNIPGKAGDEAVEDDFILKMVTFAKKRKCTLLLFSGMRRKGALCDTPTLAKNQRLFDNVFMLYTSCDWDISVKQIYSKTGGYKAGGSDGWKIERDISRPFPRIVIH